jgi:hypothetical protein
MKFFPDCDQGRSPPAIGSGAVPGNALFHLIHLQGDLRTSFSPTSGLPNKLAMFLMEFKCHLRS